MKYKPIFIGWDLTNFCNLRCKHCNRSSGFKLNNELSFKEIKEVIDQLSKNFNTIEHLSFGGGEPLLRKEFYEICKYAIKKGLPVRINTNGTLVDLKTAKKLKSLGIYHVQVSLDGNQINHDLIRGKGNFNRAVQGIKNLVKAKVDTSVRMTLFKNNHKDAESLFDYVSSLGVSRFSVGRGICSGRLKENKQIYLDKNTYFSVLNRIYQKSEKSKIAFYSTDPLALFSNEKRMNKILKKYGDSECIGGCIAGIAQFFISAEGEVYGCGLLDISAGNLKKQKLIDIWNNAELFNKLRKRREIKIKGDYCSNCKYFNLCGGCRAASYYNNHKLLSKDPFCKFKKRC